MHSGHPTRRVRAKPAQPALQSALWFGRRLLGLSASPSLPQPACSGLGAGARPLHPLSPTLPFPAGSPSLSPGIRREAEPACVLRPRGRKGWASVTRGQGWDLLSVLLKEQVKARPNLPLSSRAKARSSRASRRAGLRQKPELQRAEKDLGIPPHRLQAGSGTGP
ncbi:mid1-interacting protein 1 isoform X2 [Peromyscus californicus insignis]|uniref:mid1-interacting protein 1 isoform X2 n=1 Tax=Peromyscus californicus insignis TaxID=564181 RepID=UPI0022A6B6EF|nr:mid1-interacting protein 1 isoform X2 [Peromyscus californicus insignis]